MAESQLNNTDHDDVPISIEVDDDDDNVQISIDAADDAFELPTSFPNTTQESLQQQTTSSPQNIPQISENEKRRRSQEQTFSHYPHSSPEFIGRLIDAGLYGCNVEDRVICLGCNLICQQWIPHIDDPREVHSNLSPKCRYVRLNLMNFRLLSSSSSSPPPPQSPRSPLQTTNVSLSSAVNVASYHTHNTDITATTRHEEVVFIKGAKNPQYAEIPRRTASFANWPHRNLPSVDDLTCAGFFYTGMNNIVTCFYCNGSLQNWESNDNPTVEHARWFPHCRYARQLCGEELYWRIRTLTGSLSINNRWRANNSESRSSVAALTINRQLRIRDENTLDRLVAARLNLPISQRLLSRSFNLSVIKRCWEDQLRIKEVDFASEDDLHTACTILQRQITSIRGSNNNVTVPHNAMECIRQRLMHEESLRRKNTASNNPRNEISSESPNSSGYQYSVETASSVTQADNSQNDPELSNLCLLCFSEERRLACIPCGHFTICGPCGQQTKSCPLCRRDIDFFLRVYS